MFRWHVVSAVFARNVKHYFSGPLGYLFIIVFVTVCSLTTFNPQFFADNLANLDQLSRALPMLLLFFIPAITMSVWADEKRQGTDSILFTLPASDLDILLGKYLAVVAVYTIALLFSLFQLFNLAAIGNPDWGVIASTYAGYWLSGLALLAIGMFASSLTKSSTIAFVLGAIFCAIPVLMGHYFRGSVISTREIPILSSFSSFPEMRLHLERLGFDWNLQDFAVGLIPLSGVIYFVGIAFFMLYLNLIVISRRHWNLGQQISKAPHYIIRSVALAVSLVALLYWGHAAYSKPWGRVDLTSEKLFQLDPVTLKILNDVRDADQELTIQGFVSKDVPRKYVNTKNQLVSLLRQFAQQGGKNVQLRILEVEPNSDQATEARTAGIEPRFDRSDVNGRTIEQDVFLGAKITSSFGEVVLPSFESDSPIEYEISRAIAFTFDKKNQITIGIVDTDTFFGGPPIEGRRIQWAYDSTLNELKKQFKIKHFTQPEFASLLDEEKEEADAEKDAENKEKAEASTDPKKDSKLEDKEKKNKKLPDVLLVADPSSLDPTAMATLVKYIEAGHPTLILADPLPFRWTYQHPTQIGVINAPRQPRLSPRSPYQQVLSSSQMPKADGGTASSLLKAIGVKWDSGTVVWNLDRPHPNFKGKWPEYVEGQIKSYYGLPENIFVYARNRASHMAFNQDDDVSRGLKELMLIYPGSVDKADDSKFDFQPLVSIGKDSGTIPWNRLTKTPKQETRSLNPRTGEIKSEERAASNPITGEDLIILEPEPLKGKPDDKDHVVVARISGKGAGQNSINVVFITDLDFVSEVAYEQQAELDSRPDNLSLLTNALESLSGNTAFVNLRNRRATPRSLVRLEQNFEKFRQERVDRQQMAEEEMASRMAEEQDRLKKATREIQSDESLSFIQKLQRTSQEASDAQRRFDSRKRTLEKELAQTNVKLQTDEQKAISRVESITRNLAVLTAPIPALALGIFVLGLRYYNEQKNIAPQRKTSQS